MHVDKFSWNRELHNARMRGKYSVWDETEMKLFDINEIEIVLVDSSTSRDKEHKLCHFQNEPQIMSVTSLWRGEKKLTLDSHRVG